MDDAPDSVPARRLEDRSRALDVGRVEVLGRVEGKRRGGVHDDVDACKRPIHAGRVADVPPDCLDVREEVGSVELGEVVRDEGVALREEEAVQVDAQEPRTAGDQNLQLFHRIKKWRAS
jgi:hypothetical protein